MKTADLILCSDWHLRETTPTCRTDENFLGTLMMKVHWVSELQKEHSCPVLHAGDLFHHWKPSPYLLSLTMSNLPDQFYTIYGQHDLPQHNWQKREYSGIHVLEMAGKLKVLRGTHWGLEPEEESLIIPDPPEYVSLEGCRKILVWHKMVWQGKRLWPGQTDPNSLYILKKYPEYDLILTGDNHKAFVEEYKGRLLVNPGSLSRQDASQITFQPRTYLYFAESNTVEPVFLPIAEQAVTRDHIEKNEERSERIAAFIKKVEEEDWEIGLSFETNMKRFLAANKVLDSTKQIIYTAMDHDPR